MDTLADVARGGGYDLDLALDAAGTPQRPAVTIDLSGDVSEADRALALGLLADALPVVIGVGEGAPDAILACDVVVATAAEAAVLAARITGCPRAAIALVHLLRATEDLDVRSGLAAEAATYSMLLAGPEFAAWLAARDRAPSTVPSHVVVRRQGDRLDLVLDRPARRNAMDAALREQLVEALSVAIADPALAVSLSGAGPAFCAGGDLDEFGTATDPTSAYLVRLGRHPGWLLHQLGDRVEARLHGACIGAGIEMPAFAGRIVAASDTVIGLPELDLGLVPGAGGTVSISRRIGRLRTAWLVLSGERIDAETALAWGLVDEIG